MRLNSSYTRRSLAMLYFPDCEPRNAVRRLTGMIKRCTDLYEQLTRCSLFDKSKILRFVNSPHRGLFRPSGRLF